MEADCQNEVSGAPTVILDVVDAQVVSFEMICRICGNESDKNISIFGVDGQNNNLALKLNTYLPVKVTEEDVLPLSCCYNCTSTVLSWHELVITSIATDRRLKATTLFFERPEVEAEETINTDADTILPDSQKPVECQLDSISQIGCDKLEASCSAINSELAITKCIHIQPKSEHNLELSNENDITCHKCKTVFQTCNELNKHKKLLCNKTLRHICEICDEKFMRKIHLVKHLRTHHGKRQRATGSEKNATHFCTVCNKSYVRKHDMMKHVALKHPDTLSYKDNLKNKFKPRDFKVVGADNRVFYKCSECDKLYSHAYNLTKHRKLHTMEIEHHVCELCGKIYRSLSDLGNHRKQYHWKIKKHSCSLCDRQFFAKGAFLQHMNIHSDVRPFVCEICGKAFKQDAVLRIHKLYHFDNYRFACDICGKKYRRQGELKVHMTLHTGLRPHKCKLCPAEFRLGSTLKKHVKAHDRLQACSCDVCGATFSQTRYLNNHKRTHDNKKNASV